MMSRERRPTPEELELWLQAVGGRTLAEKPAERTAPAEPQHVPKVAPGRRARPTSAILDPHRPIDLDRRTWLRLKRGHVLIERALDLHGRTQDEAHQALNGFLIGAQAAGCRTVLVITGKGLQSGGTLRHMVPRWLNEGANRERIVAFCPAQPRDGGSGALYVLLRRRRQR